MRAASPSTLNAHYTDPTVIDAIWELNTVAGFTGGRVLEPGCGSGLFIGCAPDPVRERSRFVGVELEPVTARIAAVLYPAAEVRATGFETVRDSDGSFDVAVGNVPFGRYSVFDPIHNSEGLTIHNHFMVKSLALVKPGGLVTMVTSRYTMDARNPSARRALHAHGDLLAAIRLPGGAHHGVAGTEVVTDVLMFRRRATGDSPEPFTWERTGIFDFDGEVVRVNDWFASDGPGQVVGDVTAGRGMYGDGELMVTAPPTAPGGPERGGVGVCADGGGPLRPRTAIAGTAPARRCRQ